MASSRPTLSPPPGNPLYQAFLTQLIGQVQPRRAKGRPNSGNDPGAFHREFLVAVQDAVAAVSARVRTCPHCGWLFLRRRKQEYCSPRCSAGARLQRFYATHQRDYQREHARAKRQQTH